MKFFRLPSRRISSLHSRRMNISGPNNSERGFTLIELLVVIGVIGILAGLLLPALSRAREKGRSVQCINNLKQIGIGVVYYTDEQEAFPPGRQAGVTQWDLCIGSRLGGNPDPLNPEARTTLFRCPSARASGGDLILNYSANPNVFKEITGNVGPVQANGVQRPSDVIMVGDAIQYDAEGNSHAILWGAQSSSGAAIYWNNGSPGTSDARIPIGLDRDGPYDTGDPGGANFRYRHSERINGLFVDGHVEGVAKGNVREGNIFTSY